MTKAEAATLIRYMLTMYPTVRMTDVQIDAMAHNWSLELAGVPCKMAGEAFRVARSKSPAWMPTLPMIQAAICAIEARARPKTPEEEFRDAHCGKSQAEWAAYEQWASSEEGRAAITQYKARLKALVGV